MRCNFKSISWWFKRKFSKEHLNVVKQAWKGEPWDSGYLLDLEQAKLKEIRNYLKESNLVADTDKMVRDINICIKLLDVITEKYDIVDYDKYSFTEINNMRENGDFSYLKKHVNTHNMDHWLPNIKEDVRRVYKKMPEYLYTEKAFKLYNKIRAERIRTWWN